MSFGAGSCPFRYTADSSSHHHIPLVVSRLPASFPPSSSLPTLFTTSARTYGPSPPSTIPLSLAHSSLPPTIIHRQPLIVSHLPASFPPLRPLPTTSTPAPTGPRDPFSTSPTLLLSCYPWPTRLSPSGLLAPSTYLLQCLLSHHPDLGIPSPSLPLSRYPWPTTPVLLSLHRFPTPLPRSLATSIHYLLFPASVSHPL